MKKQKFSPFIIERIADLFACKDAESPLYMKGPQLVKLFNEMGFPDSYTFYGGKGIRTLDFGDGLSRHTYVLKRLMELNDIYKVPLAIQAFMNAVGHSEEAKKTFLQELERLRLPFPLEDNSSKPQDGLNAVAGGVPGLNKRQVKRGKERKDCMLGETQPSNAGKILNNEILGDIPVGRPVVFISYSWDSEEHKDWVAKLADDMSVKHGIHVLLDQYVPDGTMLPIFMELGLERADRVLVVGTKVYKEKSLSTNTGVTFEESVIHAGLFQNIGTSKFITCLREGDFNSAFPNLISTLKGHDFRKEENYEKELENLCRDIWKKPLRERPKLGAIPNYVNEE